MADDDGTPKPPTLDEIISWKPEEHDGAEVPEEFRTLSLEQVREHLEASRTSAVEAAPPRRQPALAQRVPTARAETERIAAIESDVRFAEELDGRLTSSDEAVRNAALAEKAAHSERYASGLAASHQLKKAGAQTTVLREHYAALTQSLRTDAQYAPFIANIQERVEKAGGNTLLAAIEYGKSLTAEAEFARGKDEGARAERIALGRAGGTDMGSGSGGGTVREDYTNAKWVTDQRVKDPEWPFKMSSDGKKTNLQRQREALSESMRRAG